MAFATFAWQCGLALLALALGAEAAGPKHNKTVVCAFATGSVYFTGNMKYDIADTYGALSMCTHFYYLYVGVDPTNHTIKSLDSYRDFAATTLTDGLGGIPNMAKLKDQFPHLKTMVDVGGWGEGSVKYSKMASTQERRAVFIQSAIDFIKKYNLDGINLTWMYPATRGGDAEDKDNLVLLMKEMQEAMSKHNLIVTLTVPGLEWRLTKGYNLAELHKHVTHLNLLGYGYHDYGNGNVWSMSPLYAAPDGRSIEDTYKIALEAGVPMEKVVLGTYTWGHTHILKEDIPDGESPIGKACEDVAYEDGRMAYKNICTKVKDGSWKRSWDKASATPYIKKDKIVVTYDDEESLTEKIKFVMTRQYGGIMLNSLDTDDFDKSCNPSPYPLLRTIDRELTKDPQSLYEDLLVMLQEHDGHYFWSGFQD